MYDEEIKDGFVRIWLPMTPDVARHMKEIGAQYEEYNTAIAVDCYDRNLHVLLKLTYGGVI